MRLTIPYAINYYAEERGGVRRRRYRGLVDVDVREAGNAEAPVALTWRSGGFNRESATNSGSQEVRVYGGDGHVYEPVLRPAGPVPMVPLEASRDGPMIALCDWLRSTEAGREIASAGDITTLLPKRPSEKLEKVQREAETKASLYAREQLLVVNGTIWARSTMPLLVIRTAQTAGQHSKYIHLCHAETMKGGDWPNAYAPADLEDAKAEALFRAQAQHPDATYGFGPGIRDLVIVDASLCQFDLADIQRRDLMHGAKNAAGSHLAFGTAELAIAYDRIRRALDRKDTNSVEEERLIEDCLAALKACDGPDIPKLERRVARMRQLSHTPERLPALPGF